VVAYRNGAPVTLSDVANVIDERGEREAGGVDERRRRR
jgi:Cu/Ag efflux pump CusA